jgi:integrase
LPLRLLTEEKVQDYIEWKLERSGHVMVRRDLAFLSAVLTRARQWKCGVKENPVALIDKRGILEADRRTTHLRPVDVQKLIAACTKEEHKRFIILAVHTGMRHQELLKLHWDEIDLKERTVYLGGHRTKNSCSREIALSSAAMDTLLSTPEHTRHGFVFKGRKDGEAMFQMGKRWGRIRERAGLPDVRIHDLRHTFASWLKQRGVAETTIMNMMGHKTRDMVRRYSHDNTESRRAAVSVLDLNTLSNTGATDKTGADPR